ncbi:hypothetical protein [Motilimonas eburnea]|uniref:hypothetical protein n=1 Tax=Motilimonas eburnea TaxID=1737488 RepID=UPI001E44B4B1|nr:hypothetical protein [Motilimonas eburnea]MCE2571967.1 hypothetical protein [Motilimonas eburnea]
MKATFNTVRKLILFVLVSALICMVLVTFKPAWLVDGLTWLLSIPRVFIWAGLILLLFFIALQRIKRADLRMPVLLVNHQVEQEKDVHLLQQLSELFVAGNEQRLHGHVKHLYLKQYCQQHQLNSRDGLKQLMTDQSISLELKQAMSFKVTPNWRQTLSFGHWPISGRAYLPHAMAILAALKQSADLT